jgi:hypothetical protein
MCRNRVSDRRAFAEVCGARMPSRRAVCARAQSARGLFVPRGACIFPRDKTGLTMGKPEVNHTLTLGLCLEYETFIPKKCLNLGLCLDLYSQEVFNLGPLFRV